MKKIISVFLLSFFLTGCIGTVPIKPEQKANIHSVSVVSLLGDELSFTKVGFTVFNNDGFTKNVTTWKLDDTVQKAIVEGLNNSSSNIKVVSLPFDRSELFKIYKSPQNWGAYTDIGRIEHEIRRQVNDSPVDAIVLVHKVRAEDPVAFTSVFVEGYGIYYRSMPLVDPLLRPFALFEISILDGKTLKPITTKYVRAISSAYGKTQISWDDQLKNNISDQLLEDFRSEIELIIKANIQSSLTELGL